MVLPKGLEPLSRGASIHRSIVGTKTARNGAHDRDRTYMFPITFHPVRSREGYMGNGAYDEDRTRLSLIDSQMVSPDTDIRI